MASGSRPFIHPQSELHKSSSVAPPLRKTWLAIFWSPLLILTAIVHVLCQPFTKQCLLAVAILDIPLQWSVHLAFRPDAATFGAIGGFDFSITTIALIGLYIGWLFSARAEGRSLRLLWNWPIVTYTAIVILSVFVARDVQLSLFQIYLMVELLLLYFYVAGNINSRREIVFVLLFLLMGCLIESGYMLVLAVVSHKLSLTPLPGTGLVILSKFGIKTVFFLPVKDVPFTRLGGTTGSPTYTAGYLGILIMLAICVRQMRVPTYLRRLALATTILAAIALIFTFTRAGWIEIALAVAIFTGARWVRNGISAKAILAALAAVLLIVACLSTTNPISDRVFGNDNGSAYSRIPLMHLAFHIISANPVLGVGANNFTAVMNDYFVPELRGGFLFTVHNEFLLVWSETGIIGLAAYLWIYFNLIRRGWRLWNTRDEMFAPLGLGIVAGICGFMSHMLVEPFLERGILQLLWIFAALIAVCEMIRKHDLREQVSSRTIEVGTR
jgi:O-antigen ligase